jgi:hypothetical protein
MARGVLLAIVAVAGVSIAPRTASAHHEALFGPQASLAVESAGFVSLQAHEHVFGTGSSLDRETAFIFSGGIAPFRTIPWSITLVQTFTYENAVSPQGDQIGPLSSCRRCVERENLLVSTSYRFDFTGLNRSTGKDGNFALVSASLEPPTGTKDYAPFHGPLNGIFAAMLGFEWSHYSTVGLGYYRVNSADSTGSKKGNNWLAGLGFAYTPIDEQARMISFQLGVAAEVHDPDVINGANLVSGGWELFASPTVVGMPARGLRFFTYVSLPFAQGYRADYETDKWRAGLGTIYSFDRGPEPAIVSSDGSTHRRAP